MISRLLFLGTARFAVPSLEALIKVKRKIVGVITQPDHPKGRGLRLLPSPVKEAALKYGLSLLQPENLQSEEIKREILELKPDLAVVVAYGKIIPSWFLEEIPYGAINIHASLLPKYRGAAPIQRAILDGVRKTGVTIIQMDEGLDTGDILLQRSVLLGDTETAGEVEEKLSRLGAKLLLEVIEKMERKAIKPQKQVGDATYAGKISKEDARIDWTKSAQEIRNLIRALNPQPGAFTFLKGKRLKIWQAVEAKSKPPGQKVDKKSSSISESGTVIAIGKDGFVVTCGEGSLLLTQVQPESRKKMTGAEFCRGYRLKVGDKLE